MFKKIAPYDEAWDVANIVNKYDDWCQKFEKLSDMTDPIHNPRDFIQIEIRVEQRWIIILSQGSSVLQEGTNILKIRRYDPTS